ncbi:MAG: Uncharacterized protein Athens071425_439 [Parcubacteria group bacterium Athens0714_25]|nr:MAG: Uncharacterized protein Athens071425_439 [Parcubacteria group bacterium Athens0714_25]
MQLTLFYISIIFLLLLPGWFLFLAVFGKTTKFSALEKFTASFGFGLVAINFLIMLLGKSGFIITGKSIIITVLFFLAITALAYKLQIKKAKKETSLEEKNDENKLFSFSKNQTALIILILALTFFIKTIYLSDTIFPTSTDLGHHMYWSKLISQTGHLPNYQESDIIQTEDSYRVSDPEPIADFIIGEHLIFSAINLLSRISFVSYFPTLILFLFNILAILAIFILTLRFFEKSGADQAQTIAILALFFAGPIYALASPQAKFASGGVIGNTFGNFLIPLAIYFFARALNEDNRKMMFSAIFTTAGMFYIHHLSSFVFIYIFIFTLLFFILFNFKNIPSYLKNWSRLVFSPEVLSLLFFCFLFLVFIYTPTYLDSSAVGTAVGTPSKSTRTGLTFSQLSFSSGQIRMALGLVGLVILIASVRRKTYSSVFLIGWTASILLMSLRPQWLYLDIPSDRIANYLIFPLIIASAFAIFWIFSFSQNYIHPKFLLASFLLLLVFSFYSGFYDNAQSLSSGSNPEKALQVFTASKYVSEKARPGERVIKDHNYLVADSWIKLFFMQDYNFPFSRSFFKRYDDPTKPREMCTLWMISTPNTENGRKCFSDLGIKFIILNPNYDSVQFEKTDQFWKIFAAKDVGVYYQKNNQQ